VKKGKVYLVGAGPGNPGLITVRALECLARADVVIYDYLSNPVFLKHAKPSAKIVYAGKRAGNHALTQGEIERFMIKEALAGRTVVRLKGGDPFLFGRGGEEASALRERRIGFEIVPGVSSGIAAPAYAGIPVTHREHASAVAMITGHEQEAGGRRQEAGGRRQEAGGRRQEAGVDYKNLAKFKGTLVFFMGVERVEKIAAELIRHGKKPSTRAALVRWGTTGSQQTLTGKLSNIGARARKARFAPPALIVIGSVVGLRGRLNWFEKLPLFGRRIVVTRTRAQAGELRRRLEELGADVLELPTIDILPPRDPRSIQRAVSRIQDFDWLVFTSPNGVDFFFEEFLNQHGDIRRLGRVRLAAIGPATSAKLKERGLKVDLMPREFVAERVAEELKKRPGRGRVLLARADIARDALPRLLRKAGFSVEEATAYRTAAPARASATARLLSEGADLVTFTSSSTVENFVKLLGKRKIASIPRRPRYVSIGPITSQTMRKLGLKVSAQAGSYTIPGLIERILKL